MLKDKGFWWSFVYVGYVTPLLDKFAVLIKLVVSNQFHDEVIMIAEDSEAALYVPEGTTYNYILLLLDPALPASLSLMVEFLVLELTAAILENLLKVALPSTGIT